MLYHNPGTPAMPMARAGSGRAVHAHLLKWTGAISAMPPEGDLKQARSLDKLETAILLKLGTGKRTISEIEEQARCCWHSSGDGRPDRAFVACSQLSTPTTKRQELFSSRAVSR